MNKSGNELRAGYGSAIVLSKWLVEDFVGALHAVYHAQLLGDVGARSVLRLELIEVVVQDDADVRPHVNLAQDLLQLAERMQQVPCASRLTSGEKGVGGPKRESVTTAIDESGNAQPARKPIKGMCVVWTRQGDVRQRCSYIPMFSFRLMAAFRAVRFSGPPADTSLTSVYGRCRRGETIPPSFVSR